MLTNRNQELDKAHAKTVAEQIVNAISQCNYAIIQDIVNDMSVWTTEFIHDLIETYKEDNEVTFDKYGTPCKFNPQYSCGSVYEQEKFYFWINGEGFGYLYDFTSNGDLNDLTLMLKFYYKGDNIEVEFEDLHVM